jgi:hypothetical protein
MAFRYLFLLLDDGLTSAPYRNLSNFVYYAQPVMITLRLSPADALFRFNTEAHLLLLSSPAPPKFIPLLSRSAHLSGAEASLPPGFNEADEGASIVYVVAGTVAALLSGFYMCFRWSSGRCYKKEERRPKLKQ